MNKTYKKGKVKTVCYGRERTWNSRNDAINFFSEGVLNSEGSEQQRYLKILVDLTLGKIVCRD
jgi:hypothetical protein